MLQESYRVFEKGISLFGFPHVETIWIAYIKRFVGRYKGKKVERARDLFEQAVEKVRRGGGTLFCVCLRQMHATRQHHVGIVMLHLDIPSQVPAKDSRKLYLLYAKFEEDYGLARRAMDVYARACAAATQADRYDMYLIYIHRCAMHFGATKTREIYEKVSDDLACGVSFVMCVVC